MEGVSFDQIGGESGTSPQPSGVQGVPFDQLGAEPPDRTPAAPSTPIPPAAQGGVSFDQIDNPSVTSGIRQVNLPGLPKADSDWSKAATWLSPDQQKDAQLGLGLAADRVGDLAHGGFKILDNTVGVPLHVAAGLAARGVGALTGDTDKLISPLPDNSVDGSRRTFSDYYRQVVPNLTFLDVADFSMQKYLGDRNQYITQMGQQGMNPEAAAQRYDGLRRAAQITGVLGDFALDPLRYSTIGTLSKAAEEARLVGSFKTPEMVLDEAAQAGKNLDPSKPEDLARLIKGVGQYTDNSRDLLTVRAPFANQPFVRIPMPAAGQSAISWVSGSRLAQAFDYRFQVPELDQAAQENLATKTRAYYNIRENFIQTAKQMDFSDDEKTLVSRLVENTPNLVPENIPASVSHTKLVAGMVPDVLDETGEPIRMKEGIVPTEVQKELGSQLGTYDPAAIEAQMRRGFEGHSQGLEINPEKQDKIIEGAMMIKRANSEMNARQWAAGILHQDNVLDAVRDQYLAHVVTPEGERAAKRAAGGNVSASEAIAAEEKAMADDYARKVGAKFSTFNPTRVQRSVEMNIEQAESAMKEAYPDMKGSFYEPDPFVGTAVRMSQSEKLVADKKFIDTLTKYGVEPSTASEANRLKARGWGNIDVPAFRGKPMIVKDNGIPRLARLEERLFPPHIVDKVGHWMKPGEIGQFSSYMNMVNRLFKTTALATPGFHMRNTVEDMFKAYAEGVTARSWSNGMITSLLKMPGMGGFANKVVTLGGKPYTFSELREMTNAFRGTTEVAQLWREGLFKGKSLWARAGGSMRDPLGAVKHVFDMARELGENGTFAMKRAHFIEMLDRGADPAAAFTRTNHVMFDFTRSNPTIDKIRTWWDPFIQHAIKTAYITPELMGKAPAAYNFFINNMPKYLSWAMSDPMTDQMIQAVIPDYAKWRDGAASPLLPGDTLMGSILRPPANGKWAALVTPEFGPDILKKFQFWDKQVMQNRFGAGPAINALITMAIGVNNRGDKVDANPNDPSMLARALRGGMDGMSSALFGTPQAASALKAALQVGDPKFAPSWQMRLMQGAFGQFMRFDNLSKDYLIKTQVFYHAYNDLQKQLSGALMKDVSGRDFRVLLSGSPVQAQKLYDEIYPSRTKGLFDKYVQAQADFMRSRTGMAALDGQKSIPEIVSEMKYITQTVDRMNEVYGRMMKAALDNAHAAKYGTGK